MSSPGTPLPSLLEGLASTAPAPGAGAAAAWTCAIAAALAAAADPPLRLARAGAELAELAADGVANARGGVRGEALAAVALANAAVLAAAPLVELNLGGAPADPRLREARELRARAQSAWCSASASP